MPGESVDTQVISNLVIQDPDGRVLFVRYDADDERWWLPGKDVEPFTHPDDAAREVLDGLAPLRATALALDHVESFRGRRGWHLVFHYRASALGEPGGAHPAEWFSPEELPRTMHGRWEKDVVGKVLGPAAVRGRGASPPRDPFEPGSAAIGAVGRGGAVGMVAGAAGALRPYQVVFAPPSIVKIRSRRRVPSGSSQ